MRLTRLSKEQVTVGDGNRVECGFVKKVTKKKAASAKTPKASVPSAKKPATSARGTASNRGTSKGKRKFSVSDDDAMEDSEEDFAAQMDGISGSSGEDEGEGNWSFSLAGSKKASKSRDPPQKKVRPIRKKSAYEDPDIIVVTSSP